MKRTLTQRLDAVHPLLLGLVLLTLLCVSCVAAWTGAVVGLWLVVGPWALLLPVVGIVAVLVVAIRVGPTTRG